MGDFGLLSDVNKKIRLCYNVLTMNLKLKWINQEEIFKKIINGTGENYMMKMEKLVNRLLGMENGG